MEDRIFWLIQQPLLAFALITSLFGVFFDLLVAINTRMSRATAVQG